LLDLIRNTIHSKIGTSSRCINIVNLYADDNDNNNNIVVDINGNFHQLLNSIVNEKTAIEVYSGILSSYYLAIFLFILFNFYLFIIYLSLTI
jgi:hypothetical protein